MTLSRRNFVGICFLGICTLGVPCILNTGKKEPHLLFDGKNLKGWNTTPRVYLPGKEPRFAEIPNEELKKAVMVYFRQNQNPNESAKAKDYILWKLKDGAIVGEQTPGSQNGSMMEFGG
jgi:hypothetical protein